MVPTGRLDAAAPHWTMSPTTAATSLHSGVVGDVQTTTNQSQRKRAKLDAASPTSSSSPPPTTKPNQNTNGKAVPTYLVQKEERLDLIEQVLMMETQLELLKIKAGVSTLDDTNSLASRKAANAAIDAQTRENHMQLARFHSLVTRQLELTPISPMALRIHLPKDPIERRRTLDDMYELKLRHATDGALDRLCALDPTKSFKHLERSSTPDGLHHMNYFEVQQFRGLRDARQLYDALVYYFDNLEICVSELIGQITVREDVGQQHPSIWNARIVTTGELGGVEELNMVGFARFYDSYKPHNGAQFGVLATDTVDEDELYPYKTHERTHKIGHGVHTISEARDPVTKERVVVLSTSAFYSQLPPEFALPPTVFAKAVENMPRWLGAMNQFLREFTQTS